MSRFSIALTATLACACVTGTAQTSGNPMSFFVTSANPGKGADFGGLEGADRHCEALATAAGAANKTWRAYLSTTGSSPVHARDRIGRGPWVNAKGQTIAASVDELHGTNQLTKATALTEKGETVAGSGDPVNMHDVLAGSTPDGRATAGGTADTTCGNWTKSGEGSAIVGHHDRKGTAPDASAQSWNSSHASKGCSMEALRSTGGGGLFYCFATN
jgi:hypothetical protein